MNKTVRTFVIFVLLLSWSEMGFGQVVKIGPRLTGNYTIYNEQGDGLTWNGLGVGIGGNVDISFNETLGILVNLTAFDMRSFSASITQQNTTQKFAYSLSYLTLDPLFKAEFSGFYMVGGPSLGMKLAGSGERTVTQRGQPPNVNPLPAQFNSVRFDIAVGTGYNFRLSPGIYMATDFMAYIPLTNAFDFPGVSNSTFSLKLGTALKFTL